MNDNEKRNLEALSSIDEKIVEWSGKKRAALKSGGRKRTSKRKWYIMGGSAVAAAALILSTVLLLVNLLGKQVPVYTGMTVSNAAPTFSASVAAVDFLANNGSGNSGLHKGQYKGDYKQEHGDLSDAFEKPIESTLTVLGSGEERYYARAGEDVYVTIHIDNPDSFEILSFTLNGEKYSSYMFEPGSDMEHLILKVNVGDVEGVVDYTIDAIKYVDGSDIKDVRMEGDQTVEIGVYTEKQPIAAVSSEVIGYNALSFTVSAADLMGLVADSAGKLEAVLYDGETLLQRQEIAIVGDTAVTFTGLKTNTVYQYAIVAHYDALDGKGYGSYVLTERTFYTKAVVLFDQISLSTTGISFALDWDEDATDRVLTALAVYRNGTKLADLETSALAVTDLLPDTAYMLVASYRNGNAEESISLEFTTDPLTYTVNHYLAELDGSYGEPIFTEINAVTLNATYTATPADYTGFVTPEVQSDTATLEGELVLNYYYLRAMYDVTLVYNNGTAANTQSLKFGAALPQPTHPNYEFGAWFTDEAYTEHISNVPARNVTVYARWVNETIASAFSYLSANDEITITGLNDKELTALIIPAYIGGKPVTTVYNNAFAGQLQLLSVKLPDTLQKLGQKAFENCTGLTELVIPDSVTHIDSHVLSGCKNIESLTIPFVGQRIVTDRDTYQYPFGYIFGSTAYDGSEPAQSYYHGNSLTSTVSATNYIPAKLKEVTVTGGHILHGAFQGCNTITSIILPVGITDIGTYAFRDCISLSSIELPSGLLTIKNGAFNGSGLTRVALPDSVTTIEQFAFAYCDNLQLVTLSKDLLTIGNGAFNGADITSITIPSKVTMLDRYVFANCAALQTVSLPASLQNIGVEAFVGCTALARVNYAGTLGAWMAIDFANAGSNPLSRGAALYIDNVNVTTGVLVIPADITSIEAYAFVGCSGITDVYFGGTAEKWESLPVVEIGNQAITNATVHYYSATEPTTAGNYWRYVDGVPTAW